MTKKIILILIIILAFVLRFYKLDSIPALNADEAAIGYNAYSLIKTGMDEHGRSWPIHFQSFNDYKPGFYFYLVLPFVKVLGLNEWAVRIPNALLGVATVYVLFLLIKELKIVNSSKNENWSLEILAPALLAISPWHIHFSRGGWEVNTATFFIVLGIYLFLKYINTKNFTALIFSLLAFIISLYTYHSARVIVPLLGLGLLLIYWKELDVIKKIKSYVPYIMFSLLLLLPLIFDLTKSGALARAKGVGILADTGPINRINEQRGEHSNLNSIEVKIFHNKFVSYGVRILDNYTRHFSGEFLFMTGDSIQRNKVPETGVLYLFDIVFLAFGVVYIFKNFRLNNMVYSLIIVWLLISPVASALTFQSPNALRSMPIVIPLTIISAIGLQYLLSLKMHKALSLLLMAIIFWNFTRYLYLYYNFMAKEYPFSSQYGVKEMVTFINEKKDSYKNIVITDRYDQPYILYLFYSKYDPKKFQQNHTLTLPDQYGFSTVRDFDKFHFYSIKYDEMRVEYPNSLIVGTPAELPKESNIIKKIYGTNGYEYFDVEAN